MTLSAKEGRERTRSVFDFRLSPRRPTGRPFVNVHNRVPHSSMAAENRIMSKSPVIKFNPDSWLFPSPHRTPLKWKLSSRLVMAAVGSLSKIWIGKFRRIWRERLRERESKPSVVYTLCWDTCWLRQACHLRQEKGSNNVLRPVNQYGYIRAKEEKGNISLFKELINIFCRAHF